MTSHEASFQKDRGQSGRMGVEATPKYKKGAYWRHNNRKEFGGSDQ